MTTSITTTSLVTGGTRGIGSVIVDVLRIRGDRVITVSSRNLDEANHISVDISSEKQLTEMAKKIGPNPLNNLVFCHRYRGDEWRKEFQISLDAVYHAIEALEKHLAPEASIVIISSNASRFILEEQPLAYHATRAALENLMRYYAVHLGTKGIRCNCIMPCTVIKPENKDFFTKDNPVTQLIEEITPLKRMGKAEDVAHLVEFLCSDKSSFITGQSFIVDGGLSVVGHESLARRLRGLPNLNKWR
jgi:NAD(P)-dependent dehydrogenase (short-subunit alcohol dehydrogenase family)